MSETYNIPNSALFLRRGPFTLPVTTPAPARAARPLDPRASHPMVADGFVWLVKLLWKQWSTRLAATNDHAAAEPSTHEAATRRRRDRLSREVSTRLERHANPAASTR